MTPIAHQPVTKNVLNIAFSKHTTDLGLILLDLVKGVHFPVKLGLFLTYSSLVVLPFSCCRPLLKRTLLLDHLYPNAPLHDFQNVLFCGLSGSIYELIAFMIEKIVFQM